MQMNQRFLQRFGEPPPFGDTIARAALRYDPDAAYGELATGDNEGQRLVEQPNIEPSMNRDSMVAAEGPMSHPRGINTPPAPMENPIVRAQRERAELAPGPSLDYDSELSLPERKLFQPPTIPSSAAKSIVSIDDAPEIDPGRLSQPPVIDTRELPTAPPPESTLQRLMR